jgi:hypothetical protein
MANFSIEIPAPYGIEFFKSRLAEVFARLRSPFHEIFIYCDVNDIVVDGRVIRREKINFRVVAMIDFVVGYEPPPPELIKMYQELDFIELAKIKIDSPSKGCIHVVVESLPAGEKRWHQVEELFQYILEKFTYGANRSSSDKPTGDNPDNVIHDDVPLLASIPAETEELDHSNFSNLSPVAFQDSEINHQNLSLLNDGDPFGNKKKYGTDGDITANQIRTWMKQCKWYKDNEGSIRMFYDEELSEYHKKFTFQTFRSWRKDPRFKPK